MVVIAFQTSPIAEAVVKRADGQIYRLHPAEGEWYQIPTPEAPPLTDPTSLARATISDRTNSGGVPLDAPINIAQPPHLYSFGDNATPPPEVPMVPGEIVSIGTVNSFHSVLTPSRLSIYTVLSVSVEEVMTHDDQSRQLASSFDVVVDGGVIQLNSGRIIKQIPPVSGSTFDLHSGHRYLLFLYRFANGYAVQKSWELRDGFALPNSLEDNDRAREGKSRYSGSTEAEFLRVVRQSVGKFEAGQ